ncbi:adenosine deaminase [Amnibacterium endophyticum]|uniref:Adenosine deaminase n=1 Tax=Amnibacterium endophyticum TaxID=2109337 RepID=A0ABW4LH83_9MICO
MTRDLAALPKAHLHLHFEAAMRPSTLAELAAEADQPVPRWAPFDDFQDFEAAYGDVLGLIRSRRHLARIMDDLADDAAAQGARYVEVTLAPVLHAALFDGDVEAALQHLLQLAAEAEVRTGVTIRAMIASARTFPVELALEDARLAAAWAGSGVVSFGLHADERGAPAAPFGDAFAIARDAGLLITPHAGELVGAESVREAVELLHADRILHGVRAIEDEGLVARLAELGTCLDVCPSSNLRLHVVPDLEHHPLPALLAAGVTCSINADDPLQFGPGLLEEYELCRSALGLDDERLAACARASFTASGAPDEVKRRALADIDAWLAA